MSQATLLFQPSNSNLTAIKELMAERGAEFSRWCAVEALIYAMEGRGRAGRGYRLSPLYSRP